MRYIARLVILIMLSAMFAMPASAGSIRVYVTDNTLKYYSEASSSSAKLGTLGYGQKAKCVDLEGDWALIEVGGAQVWCKVGGLSTDDPNTGDLTAYVVSGGAKAYALPSSSADSASISGGTKLTVVAMTPDKEWCRVRKSGEYAYMKTGDLATEKAAEDAEKNEAPAESESSDSNVTAYIADETVKIYSSKSSSSSRAATAAYGEKVTCIAIDGSWAQVKYGDVTGWCYKNKLTTADPNTSSTTVYAKEIGTKVYTQPESSEVMTTIGTATALKCVAATPDGKWLRVTASGKYGYVKKAEMSTTKAESKVDQLLNLAAEQLGKPYVYATRGPKSFDCSGLTLYCFREIYGIALGRSAQLQGYNEKYPKVESMSDVKKGDIVCFNTVEDDEDLTDHVGIYIGDGKFIHASSEKGEVIISSMSSGYYKRVFSWARRLAD